MTQASLVPCETQRIGPRTQRCSVPRTKGGSARSLPWNQASLLVTQRFGRIDPGGLAGRKESGEQRGEVGEADDHTQGAPGHRVADTGDLLLKGVNDPDR